MAKSPTTPVGDSSSDPPKHLPILNGPPQTKPKPEATLESEAEPGSPFAQELQLEAYRVDQDFTQHIQTVKKPISIPVQRPNCQDWIQIHPSPEWRMRVNLLEDRINRQVYLVARNLFPEVMNDIRTKLLVAYATKRGTWGLWPIRVRDERGALDTYNESAHAIVLQYPGQWIRIFTNQADGVFEPIVMANIEAPMPHWPEGGFNYLFQLAFKNRVINCLDHSVLRGLRGEI